MSLKKHRQRRQNASIFFDKPVLQHTESDKSKFCPSTTLRCENIRKERSALQPLHTGTSSPRLYNHVDLCSTRTGTFAGLVPRQFCSLLLLWCTICISISWNGTYSQSFAPNCLRGEQIGALFNSHSFCTVVVDVENLEDLCGRKKGLCHRFWVFPGCSTKTDSCKFELCPARTACF